MHNKRGRLTVCVCVLQVRRLQRGQQRRNGAIWQSISNARHEFSPMKKGRAMPGSLCDVLLCVILTELAAAAAENCTTIADLLVGQIKFRIFDQRMANIIFLAVSKVHLVSKKK